MGGLGDVGDVGDAEGVVDVVTRPGGSGHRPLTRSAVSW